MSSKEKGKGKGKAKEVVSGKRKTTAGRTGVGVEGSRRKLRKLGVLRFIDHSAEVDDDDASDDSNPDNCMTERSSFY